MGLDQSVLPKVPTWKRRAYPFLSLPLFRYELESQQDVMGLLHLPRGKAQFTFGAASPASLEGFDRGCLPEPGVGEPGPPRPPAGAWRAGAHLPGDEDPRAGPGQGSLRDHA